MIRRRKDMEGTNPSNGASKAYRFSFPSYVFRKHRASRETQKTALAQLHSPYSL